MTGQKKISAYRGTDAVSRYYYPFTSLRNVLSFICSLVRYSPSYKYVLSPAYDLLPVNLIMPEDTEEFALAMNDKKANIRKEDFLIFAGECGIPGDAAVKMIKSLLKRKPLLLSMNMGAMLPENMKKAFSELIEERCSVLS